MLASFPMRITQETATSFQNRQNLKKKFNLLLGWEECRETGLLSCSAAASVWYHLLLGNNPPQLGKAANHLALTTLPSHR